MRVKQTLGFGSLAYALDGYFIGLTRGRILSSAMVAAALVGFVPLGWWAYKQQSPHLLWLALSLFMVARVISLAVFVPQTLRVSGVTAQSTPGSPRSSDTSR